MDKELSEILAASEAERERESRASEERRALVKWARVNDYRIVLRREMTPGNTPDAQGNVTGIHFGDSVILIPRDGYAIAVAWRFDGVDMYAYVQELTCLNAADPLEFTITPPPDRACNAGGGGNACYYRRTCEGAKRIRTLVGECQQHMRDRPEGVKNH